MISFIPKAGDERGTYRIFGINGFRGHKGPLLGVRHSEVPIAANWEFWSTQGPISKSLHRKPKRTLVMHGPILCLRNLLAASSRRPKRVGIKYRVESMSNLFQLYTIFRNYCMTVSLISDFSLG